MKRLMALLMLLFMPTAHAEAPPVILLPEGLFCLADAPVGSGAETRLLVTAEPDANAVRLAIAVRDEDGVCRLEALSGPFLPLDNWNPDALWLQDKWQDGRPCFWWGAGKPETMDEIYLQLGQNATGTWTVTSGFVKSNITGDAWSFSQDEPGFLQVNGETISPAIVWPTTVSLTLEGFDLPSLAAVCRDALVYLEDFKQRHTVDEQDEIYRINWW